VGNLIIRPYERGETSLLAILALQRDVAGLTWNILLEAVEYWARGVGFKQVEEFSETPRNTPPIENAGRGVFLLFRNHQVV